MASTIRLNRIGCKNSGPSAIFSRPRWGKQGIMPLTKPSSFAIACVVGRHSRFMAETVLWTHCGVNHPPTDKFHAMAYYVDARDEASL
jgi:hypothetical protein